MASPVIETKTTNLRKRQPSMKKIVLITGVFVLLFASSYSDAQARKFSFFVAPEFGTITSPEDVTDLYSSGIGGSIGLEYSLSTKFSLVWMANYKKFTPDEESLLAEFDVTDEYPGATDISIGDGTLHNIIVSLQAKVKLKGANSSFWPYLKGGVGYSLAGSEDFLFKFTDVGGSPMEESGFGIDVISAPSVLAAFGLELKRGSNGSYFVEIGIEVSYLDIEGDEDDPEDVGGPLDLVTVPIRVGFSF